MSLTVVSIIRTTLLTAVLICSASAFAQGGVTNETLQEAKKNLKPTNSPAAQEMAKPERKAPTPKSQPFGTPPPATYAPSHPKAELRGKPMISTNAPTKSNSQYQSLPNNSETVGSRQGPNGHYSDPPPAPRQQVNSGQYQNLPNNSETVGARQGPNGHYSDPPPAPRQQVDPLIDRQKSQVTIGEHRQQPQQYTKLDLGPEGNRAANARAESNARARGIEPVYQNAPNGNVNNPAQRQYQVPNPPPGGGYQQLPKSQGNAPQQYTKLDLGPEGNRAANARAESNARARGIEPVYQNAPNRNATSPAQRQYQVPNPPPGGGYQQLPKSQGNAPQQYTKLDLGPEGNRAANTRAETNARAKGIEPVYQNAPNGNAANQAQRQYQIPDPPPGGGYQQLPTNSANSQQYQAIDLTDRNNPNAGNPRNQSQQYQAIDLTDRNNPNAGSPRNQSQQYQAIDLTDRNNPNAGNPRNQSQQYQAIDLTDRNNIGTGSPQNQRQYQVPNPPPGGGYQQLQTTGAQQQQYERLDLGARQPEVNARAEANARARGIEPVYQNTPNGGLGNQAQRQYQIPDPASSDRYQQLEKRPNGTYSAPPVGGNPPVNGQYAAPPVGGNPPVNGQYAAPPVGGNPPVNGQYSAPPVGGNPPANRQYAAPPVGGNPPVNGQYAAPPVGGNPPANRQYAAPPVGGNPPANGQYQQLKVNPPEKPSRANKPNLNNPPEKPSRANKPNLNNPPEKPSRANKPNLNNPPEKPSRANKPKLNSSSATPARTNNRPSTTGNSRGGSTRPKTRSPR